MSPGVGSINPGPDADLLDAADVGLQVRPVADRVRPDLVSRNSTGRCGGTVPDESGERKIFRGEGSRLPMRNRLSTRCEPLVVELTDRPPERITDDAGATGERRGCGDGIRLLRVRGERVCFSAEAPGTGGTGLF